MAAMQWTTVADQMLLGEGAMTHHEVAVAAMNGGFTRQPSISVILAHFVVAADVSVDDLQWLFQATPANVVVVSYDVWREDNPSISFKLETAVERLNQAERLWEMLVMSHGAIVAKTTRISAVAEELSIGGDGPHRFICCEYHITQSYLSASGSITLGFFSSKKNAGPYNNTWLQNVCSAVEANEVRYMCGVFWRGKEETEELFRRLGACEDGIFFQPFWTDVSHGKFSDDEMAAVAARFGVLQHNASYLVLHPAYFVVLDPSKEVIRPEFCTQPRWDDELFPRQAIQSGLVDVSEVPQLPQRNEVKLPDSLPLTQKKAPLHLWKKGVHQLLLWVGSSRPSRKCRRNKQIWWANKWQGWWAKRT